MAVDDLSLELLQGETTALIGESGSGKSITALAVMRLLPNAAKIKQGDVILNGEALFSLPEYAMRTVRGKKIGMIFQEPQNSLNPVLTCGQQIGEVLEHHQSLSGQDKIQKTIELLDAVGIPEPERRVNEYPHQFSGGMKQRVMIAMALACEPRFTHC